MRIAPSPVRTNTDCPKEMWTNTTAGRDQFSALVGVLRQEYAALAWLAFKASQTELLTDAHEARFLPMIIDEVDEIAEELGTIEIARAMIVDELCEALGYRDDSRTLWELIAEAPADIAPVLSELRSQLLELTEGLSTTASRGTATAKARLAAIRAALDNLEPAAGTETGYDQWGARHAPSAPATRFDTSL